MYLNFVILIKNIPRKLWHDKLLYIQIVCFFFRENNIENNFEIQLYEMVGVIPVAYHVDFLVIYSSSSIRRSLSIAFSSSSDLGLFDIL